MALPPSRRDVTGPPPRNVSDLGSIVRHHESWQRRFALGGLGGRFGTPSPVLGKDSPLVGGGDGAGDLDSVLGEDGDRLTLTNLGTQVWGLSYVPISETLHLRWHPDGEEGITWERGELYTIDDDSNVVVIPAASLTACGAVIGDVFSAQYLRLEDQDNALELEGLTLRGGTQSIPDPAALPGGGIQLPVGTQVGDLIVAANATMDLTGTPGVGTISDSRLTQVGHGTWVGIATHLGPVIYSNPGVNSRHSGAVATFVAPAYYLNDTDAGPATGGTGLTMVAPTVTAIGAVLVFTEDNPNSTTGTINSYPAGYLVAVDPNTASTICKAGIFYWPPDGSASSPSGNIGYTSHNSGLVYATAIGLQGETG